VAVDGKVVWAEGFGEADVASHRAVTTSTEFRIGSVSKALTAACAATLVDAGKLDLDAPVQRYVPSFPVKPWPITARELGAHTGGIRHYNAREPETNKHYDSVTASLAIFARDPLLYEPKTHFFYSSFGINLLSAEIEGAAGEPFLDTMRTHVTGPLALTHTEPDKVRARIPDRTTFYVRNGDGTVSVAPEVDNSYKWASGGYLSTPRDLVRFGSALLSPGLLTPASLRLLFTEQRTRDGAGTGYGFGFELGSGRLDGHRAKHDRRWVGHRGDAVGGETSLRMWPDKRLVIALAANANAHADRKSGTYRSAELIGDVFADALVAEQAAASKP
jgi:CubicO group peptidase (beta-lactamase class C family)